MSHWHCPACQHFWDDRLPDSMEIAAAASDNVVEAFVLPGTCLQYANWHTTLITEFQAQIIEAALAPASRTLCLTDDTTNAELSAFIRGKRYPTYDPDNPPVRDNTKLGPWKERFLQRVAKHRARWLPRRLSSMPT